MYVYGGVEDNRSKNYLMHGMAYASRVGKVGFNLLMSLTRNSSFVYMEVVVVVVNLGPQSYFGFCDCLLVQYIHIYILECNKNVQ